MKINWVQKLTSRKFWAAVIGFVVPLLTAFGVTTSAAAQITAIIMAGATLIAYIVGEGLVDAAGASGTGQSTVGIPANNTVSADAAAITTDVQKTITGFVQSSDPETSTSQPSA